jgi:hypothetical protein
MECNRWSHICSGASTTGWILFTTVQIEKEGYTSCGPSADSTCSTACLIWITRYSMYFISRSFTYQIGKVMRCPSSESQKVFTTSSAHRFRSADYASVQKEEESLIYPGFPRMFRLCTLCCQLCINLHDGIHSGSHFPCQ